MLANNYHTTIYFYELYTDTTTLYIRKRLYSTVHSYRNAIHPNYPRDNYCTVMQYWYHPPFLYDLFSSNNP